MPDMTTSYTRFSDLISFWENCVVIMTVFYFNKKNHFFIKNVLILNNDNIFLPIFYLFGRQTDLQV